ncbi:MAG TPA: MFS transporter [Acidimicrobiales bacterium]|nr:MFS transporter [Acidimicrobiales bacterium]
MSLISLSPVSTQRAADPGRWKALAVLACLQFMLILDATVVNVALPSIKADLGFTQSNLAWVVDAYVLVAGGFLLLGGRVADLFGRRRIFLAGAIAFAAGSLASGLAQDQIMLIGARALQGLGEALAGPAALSIITVLFTDQKERTTALSIWGGLAGVGGVSGALLSGVIIDVADWRWIFWINLPVTAAVLIVSLRLVPNDRHRARNSFDFAGAVTATGAITAVVYALLEANRNGWASTTTVGFFAVGAALLVAFVAIENRLRSPLVPLRFFRARRPRTASGLMVLVASALYGMFFLLTLYMQQVLGWTPLHTGVAYVIFGLGMLAGIGTASQLVPRLGVRPLVVSGMTLAAGGLASYTRLGVRPHYWSQMVPGMVLMSAGFGLCFVTITVAAVSEANDADAGLASGVVTTAQQVGGALGLAVLVSIATTRASSLLASGHTPATAQLGGSHLAFGIGAGLLAMGALLAAALIGRYKPQALPTPKPITPAEDDEGVEFEALGA